MKTYCVVTRTGNYTIQAEDVFQVDDSHGQAAQALAYAISHNRPLSVKVAWGWVTHNAELAPFSVHGRIFRRLVS